MPQRAIGTGVGRDIVEKGIEDRSLNKVLMFLETKADSEYLVDWGRSAREAIDRCSVKVNVKLMCFLAVQAGQECGREMIRGSN